MHLVSHVDGEEMQQFDRIAAKKHKWSLIGKRASGVINLRVKCGNFMFGPLQASNETNIAKTTTRKQTQKKKKTAKTGSMTGKLQTKSRNKGNATAKKKKCCIYICMCK